MSKDQRKTGNRSFIFVTTEQLMHAAARQAALHGPVKGLMPRHNGCTGFRDRNSFQRCDLPPEGCKRLHRLDHKNVLYMFFSDL